MERKDLKPRFINGFWWLDLDQVNAVLDTMENHIKELDEYAHTMETESIKLVHVVATLKSNIKKIKEGKL